MKININDTKININDTVINISDFKSVLTLLSFPPDARCCRFGDHQRLHTSWAWPRSLLVGKAALVDEGSTAVSCCHDYHCRECHHTLIKNLEEEERKRER